MHRMDIETGFCSWYSGFLQQSSSDSILADGFCAEWYWGCGGLVVLHIPMSAPIISPLLASIPPMLMSFFYKCNPVLRHMHLLDWKMCYQDTRRVFSQKTLTRLSCYQDRRCQNWVLDKPHCTFKEFLANDLLFSVIWLHQTLFFCWISCCFFHEKQAASTHSHLLSCCCLAVNVTTRCTRDLLGPHR